MTAKKIGGSIENLHNLSFSLFCCAKSYNYKRLVCYIFLFYFYFKNSVKKILKVLSGYIDKINLEYDEGVDFFAFSTQSIVFKKDWNSNLCLVELMMGILLGDLKTSKRF